jgi:hypothetical protein
MDVSSIIGLTESPIDHSEASSTEEDHIKVCVRIRALLKDEILKLNEQLAWTWADNSISQDSRVINAHKKSSKKSIS